MLTGLLRNNLKDFLNRVKDRIFFMFSTFKIHSFRIIIKKVLRQFIPKVIRYEFKITINTIQTTYEKKKKKKKNAFKTLS